MFVLFPTLLRIFISFSYMHANMSSAFQVVGCGGSRFKALHLRLLHSRMASSSSSLELSKDQKPAQKYGTPVGIVILPNKEINSFKIACYKALPHVKKIVNRGVDPHLSNDSGYKKIHVPTEVAAALVDGNEILVDFLMACGGEFVPGVRREKGNRRVLGTPNNWRREERVPSNPDGDSKLQPKPQPQPPSKFTFVELFAGIGGFRLGLEKIGGSCVLASERHQIACQLYSRHFGSDHMIRTDMLDIVSDDFPPDGFDVLTAGFPCQPFSRRGEQKGLEDDNHRGQMYQELVRILMEQRPPFFLFENVVGLVTMDGGCASHYTGEHIFKSGKVMDKILEAFRECGYKVEWQVVNAGRFVPQYRERVYFVGSLLELNCPDMEWDNIYPSDDNLPPVLREIMDTDYLTSETIAQCEISEQQWTHVQKVHYGEALTRAKMKVDDYAPTLISSYRTPASTATRFIMEEADGTLRHGNPLRPRFLTPTEFSRIMGFPADFDTSPPHEGDAQYGHIYRGLGNAVVPPVVEAIGREMLRLMDHVEQNTNNKSIE